jgi:prepilin-type N-terminal cleavage/methylation domain-containing protein
MMRQRMNARSGDAATGSVVNGYRTGRTGFSIVEVIVAIALFGVSMSAIGALTFAVTRQSATTGGNIDRTAAIEARANDLFSIAWTDIDGRLGCTTITAQPLPRTECITTTTLSATRRRVTLTITPTDPSLHPTTVAVERSRPPSANPFRAVP